MAGYIVAIVLCGALLHATWNALVKGGQDPFLSTVLVAGGAAAISALCLPWLAQPAPASWPYLAASTTVHFAYYGLLAGAYRHGDMSHAYPLMRGSAPLMVALASVPLLGERLAPVQYAAVACICGGMFGLWLGAAGRAVPRASAFALLNSVVIAAYTLIDGLGARASHAPAAYVMWLHVLSAAGLLAWTLVRRPAQLASYGQRHWRVAALGGAGTLGSYGLSLWAMTMAPLAAVAALRETAILFAALIARIFLGEAIGGRRAVAIAAIAAGAILMRLS